MLVTTNMIKTYSRESHDDADGHDGGHDDDGVHDGVCDGGHDDDEHEENGDHRGGL